MIKMLKIGRGQIEEFEQKAIKNGGGRSVLEEYAEYLGCEVKNMAFVTSEDGVTEEEKRRYVKYFNNIVGNNIIKEFMFGMQRSIENYAYEVGGKIYIVIYIDEISGILTKY